MGPDLLAGGPGFEPGRDDPESPMLPLHHPPTAELIIAGPHTFDKAREKLRSPRLKNPPSHAKTPPRKVIKCEEQSKWARFKFDG